jgi:hypothetical protein
MGWTMSDHYLADTAKIRALRTSITSLLDSAAEEPLDRGQLARGVKLLAEAFQAALNLGSKQLFRSSPEDYGRALGSVREAYSAWRDVAASFERALSDAYNGYTARENLLIDATYSALDHQIGEPIAALHAKLHAAWLEYLRHYPWNEYMAPDVADPAQGDMVNDLKSLILGDHLDLEDAVEHLTGPLRHAFVAYLHAENKIDVVEEGLWLRPEIMLINDYWRFNKQTRIIDAVCSKGHSRRTSSFERMRNLLESHSHADARWITDALEPLPSVEKSVHYRCLMLHPDQSIRRYAVNNVDIESFWKVVTPQAVPCATILSMLERVVGSQRYDETSQKVFFQAIHKRLFNLTSRSELIYARGIVRILSRMPFFMEDEYFEKLMQVIDYLSTKEKTFKLTDGLLDEYIDNLRREKDKIGTLTTAAPNLTSIPPVVLRKLARDGHHWYELSMHPMFKIARETIRHINSPQRAARVASNHVANTDVLREIGRKRSLFNTVSAKMTLLANPRTPPAVSMGYLLDLSRTDVEALLRRSTVHPELRLQLRRRIDAGR